MHSQLKTFLVYMFLSNNNVLVPDSKQTPVAALAANWIRYHWELRVTWYILPDMKSFLLSLILATTLLTTVMMEAEDDMRVMLPVSAPRLQRGVRSLRYRGVQGLADKGLMMFCRQTEIIHTLNYKIHQDSTTYISLK